MKITRSAPKKPVAPKPRPVVWVERRVVETEEPKPEKKRKAKPADKE